MLLKNQTRRQTTRTALIFSLLALLIVSIGCKKETKIPTPADANALIGTMWTTQPPDNNLNSYFKDTILFLNNGMYKQSSLKNNNSIPMYATMDMIMNNTIDTFMKIYYVYTYNNGNGVINYLGNVFQGIPPNQIYIGRYPKLYLSNTFTIENDKLTLVIADGGQLTGTIEGMFVKRQNFNLYQ